MPTGACGINCDVCKLKLLEICSSCGHGKSLDAEKKLEAQKRILGGTCPILSCAQMNRIEYCMRDCNSFPCYNFFMGPYPFSQGFLNMQERRRQEKPPAFTPNKTPIEVPPEYWEKLRTRNITTLCNLTLAELHPTGAFVFRSLGTDVLVDRESCCIKRLKGGRWEISDDPLFELITLLYLINVESFYPFGKDIVGPRDLKEAHYFKDHHTLNLSPLLERYGNDLQGFKKAAENLEGRPIDMADVAYMLLPFPRVPLYYLFWEGDEEFPARISVLFDRSIEEIFSASAIWMLVRFVSMVLLK